MLGWQDVANDESLDNSRQNARNQRTKALLIFSMRIFRSSVDRGIRHEAVPRQAFPTICFSSEANRMNPSAARACPRRWFTNVSAPDGAAQDRVRRNHVQPRLNWASSDSANRSLSPSCPIVRHWPDLARMRSMRSL